ncbi:MAG TPA: hypothetical protein P5256_01560 [Beijerinckiaceae bacterium]|nr:hypothetical protein [Rhodoblastus sp.]MCC2106165.1 hypothetical protein [Hyphomicrobiales bacterium]HPG02454.1 hypothetical protein [Rhodoblastus sp.]HRY01783.1 hypothetical protein [Beijerinckiaceae bacterium]
MRQYRPGYCDVLEAIATNSLAQNLRLIDDLDGRRQLSSPHDEEAVRQEASRQVEREFRTDRNQTLSAIHHSGEGDEKWSR